MITWNVANFVITNLFLLTILLFLSLLLFWNGFFSFLSSTLATYFCASEQLRTKRLKGQRFKIWNTIGFKWLIISNFLNENYKQYLLRWLIHNEFRCFWRVVLGKADKYNICLQEFRNNLFKVDDESKENSLDLKMAFSINIVLGIFQP